MKRLVLSAIAISASLVLAGCGVPQSQPPSTVPVTPGYIRGYDHQLNFGFDYPEDWEEEVPQFETPYERVEVFTKKGEPTQIVVSVKLTNLKSLAEVKGFGYINEQSILKEGFVNINDRLAYEVIFKQYPNNKAKWVIFLANDREYRIECYTTEDFYPAREEIFDYVIASFVIG
jgi:hypothetical protein